MSKTISEEEPIGRIINNLEPERDNSEKSEGRRFRAADNLDDTLKAFLRPVIGPHIVNKTFRIASPLTRVMDITFSRYYPQLNLLTHSFARHRTYQNLNDPEFDAELLRMTTYAQENGFLFLPIIDGEVEREDLLRTKIGLSI